MNADGETCWLNVLLQLLLWALDYDTAHALFSPMGKLLEKSQAQALIDSRDFKVLIQNEIITNTARYQGILTEFCHLPGL